MSSPASDAALGAIGIGATIVGGAEKVKGAVDLGIAQLRQNYYQAGIAMFNQNVAKQNADFARNEGEQEATKYGGAASQQSANIKASQGSSGVDVNSGSTVEVRAGQEKVQKMDLDQIRSNAAKVAYGFDVQSRQFELQSNLYKMAGTNAVGAANINAEASMIGTVGSVADKWMQVSDRVTNSLSGGGSGGQSYGGEGFTS